MEYLTALWLLQAGVPWQQPASTIYSPPVNSAIVTTAPMQNLLLAPLAPGYVIVEQDPRDSHTYLSGPDGRQGLGR